MTIKTDTPKESRSRRRPRRKWHMVTNHQNMLYMLAAGMVMGPVGFRGKHYSDSLSVYPGWIPLFRDKMKIPATVLQQAVSERKHLRPCVASFDLSDLSSPVRMLSCDGRLRDVTSPAVRKHKDDIAILVHAPLPLNLLLNIQFRTIDDRQAFERAAADVSNVDLRSHRIEVVESMFATDADVIWPVEPSRQEQLFPSEDDNFPATGLALGGALTMLYHTANYSDLGLAVFRLITETACYRDVDLVQRDPILAEIRNWIHRREISRQADTRAQLFWGVIQSLMTEQTKKHPQAPISVVLAYLEDQLAGLSEVETRPHLERLMEDMRAVGSFGGGTITALLERHNEPLSRSLLLFCLREHCTELLEFSHSLLKDTEYLLAGILFGVRDSWLRLPTELRSAVLCDYVTYRMTDVEHRNLGDAFTLDAPPCPKPLREFFTLSDGEWSNWQKDVALELAHDCEWEDCIQTRITLAKGDYPHHFERSGQQILLPGRIENTVEIIQENRFLKRLAQWPPISCCIESKVRKKLARLQESTEPESGKRSLCG